MPAQTNHTRVQSSHAPAHSSADQGRPSDSEIEATQGGQFSAESDARPDRPNGHNEEPDSNKSPKTFLRSKSASKMAQ